MKRFKRENSPKRVFLSLYVNAGSAVTSSSAGAKSRVKPGVSSASLLTVANLPGNSRNAATRSSIDRAVVAKKYSKSRLAR